MTSKELQEGLYWAWNKTYSYSSIIKRVIGSRCIIGYSLLANLGYRHYAKKLKDYGGHL